MTVVDVNTGKFTGSGGNLEQTVTKNNLEAAEEIVRQLRLRDIGGIVVIDFIDMVLESNRDLVLRRLTESLGRDRTRHQVSEVTSLGLVQLTRKKLGTGLIEAFSTSCPNCVGRGLLLHADPVDSAVAASGRKSESGGRRGRRSKKNRSEEEEQPVAKVPAHAPGEHPMFKAMATATSVADDDDDESDEPDEELTTGVDELAQGRGPADLEDTDEDDLDDDDDDDDDHAEDDDDDEDDDLDEDVDVVDDDEELDENEDEDLDDDDDDLDDEDSESNGEVSPGASIATEVFGRPRRRAAGRPAGPPLQVD